MTFQFQNYDRTELNCCGREFRAHFVKCPHVNDGEWTHAVRDWFRKAAAPGIRVYPAAGMGTARKDEFILDLCHTTYPLDGSGGSWPSEQWYERAFGCCCEMKLALESEWGTFVQVLDDACKLAVLRAAVKVMIFSSHWNGPQDRVVKSLYHLRKCHNDTAPWLCIDVVSRPPGLSADEWEIRYNLLTK
jgi:hypothetical protein